MRLNPNKDALKTKETKNRIFRKPVFFVLIVFINISFSAAFRNADAKREPGLIQIHSHYGLVVKSTFQKNEFPDSSNLTGIIIYRKNIFIFVKFMN